MSADSIPFFVTSFVLYHLCSQKSCQYLLSQYDIKTAHFLKHLTSLTKYLENFHYFSFIWGFREILLQGQEVLNTVPQIFLILPYKEIGNWAKIKK